MILYSKTRTNVTLPAKERENFSLPVDFR